MSPPSIQVRGKTYTHDKDEHGNYRLYLDGKLKYLTIRVPGESGEIVPSPFPGGCNRSWLDGVTLEDSTGTLQLRACLTLRTLGLPLEEAEEEGNATPAPAQPEPQL